MKEPPLPNVTAHNFAELLEARILRDSFEELIATLWYVVEHREELNGSYRSTRDLLITGLFARLFRERTHEPKRTRRVSSRATDGDRRQ